jgi:hypothetical protein
MDTNVPPVMKIEQNSIFSTEMLIKIIVELSLRAQKSSLGNSY